MNESTTFFVRKLNETELLNCLEMLRDTEGFCEDVGYLIRGRNVLKINETGVVNFANIMKTRIDMFRAGVLDVVSDVILGSFGIGEQRDGAFDWGIDGCVQFAEENSFLRGVRGPDVLGFHGGYRDDGLLAGLMGNGATFLKEDEARMRFAIVWVRSVRCVRVTEEGWRMTRIWIVADAKIESAVEVAKCVLCSLHVVNRRV